MEARNIVIELSAAQWHTLLGHLDSNSPAYSMVKSVIETNEAPITMPLTKVALMCNEEDAAAMLHVAESLYPEIVPSIMTAFANSRK
jgi:hypothetical protein